MRRTISEPWQHRRSFRRYRQRDRLYDPNLHRSRGDMLLKRDPANPTRAEGAFLTAIAVAKQQGSARPPSCAAVAGAGQAQYQPDRPSRYEAHGCPRACAREAFRVDAGDACEVGKARTLLRGAGVGPRLRVRSLR